MNRLLAIVKNDFLLYFSIFLLLSNYMLFTAFQWGLSENFSFLKMPLRIFVFSLMFLYLFKQEKIKIIFIFLIIFLLLLFFINNNEFLLNIVFLLLFFSSFLRVKLDDFIYFIFISYLFYFLLHNFLLFSGVLSNEVASVGERVRNGFGFTNVNRLGMFYFYFFIICFFNIINSKFKSNFYSFSLLFFCAISLGFIKLSESRTALYCCFLIVALYFLGRFKLFSYLQRSLVSFLLPICFLISIVLSSNFGLKFDELLSYRPTFFNEYIDIILSKDLYIFLGMPVIEDLTIDNSYLLFLGAVGLIISFVFIFASPFILYRRFIPERYVLIIIVSLFYGIFESNLLRVEMLVPIVVLFSMLFGKKDNYL
jgi:hypothetical protein